MCMFACALCMFWRGAAPSLGTWLPWLAWLPLNFGVFPLMVSRTCLAECGVDLPRGPIKGAVVAVLESYSVGLRQERPEGWDSPGAETGLGLGEGVASVLPVQLQHMCLGLHNGKVLICAPSSFLFFGPDFSLVPFSPSPFHCLAFRTPVCKLALGFSQDSLPGSAHHEISVLSFPTLPARFLHGRTATRLELTKQPQVSTLDLPRTWGLLGRSVAPSCSSHPFLDLRFSFCLGLLLLLHYS